MQSSRIAIGVFAASLMTVGVIASIMRVQGTPAPERLVTAPEAHIDTPETIVTASENPVVVAARQETAPATAPATTTAPDTTYEQHMQERDGQRSATSPDAPITLAEPDASPFSVQLNLDATNQYFYHGIIQEDTGLILQPAARMTVNLYEHEDIKVDAVLGAWNSFHSQQTGASTSSQSDFTRAWYELDLIAGVVFTRDRISLATTYTFLNSPSDAFQTVEELAFTCAYDDHSLLGEIALHPYAMLSIETGANGSDGPDSDRGTYLELGIAPGFSFDVGKTPISVQFPMSVGLSIDDYYQNAAGEDDIFGFAQVGVKASMPLPFGDHFGQWTLNASVAALYLGDHTAAYNNGDNLEFIATLGVQLNF